MAQPYNSFSEFPYAEAATSSAKRISLTPQGVPPPWTTSITESTIVCTEDKVFVIGGVDTCTQRIVPYARTWDALSRIWTRLPDAPVRVAHASAVSLPTKGSIILFGGWDGAKCNAELWHFHPQCLDSATAGGEGVSPLGLRATGGEGHPTTPPTAPGRSPRGDDVAMFQWDRLEADSRISERPVGRFGHALAFGVSPPTAQWKTHSPSSPAAGSLQLSDEVMGHAAAAALAFSTPGLTAAVPVMYLFGGNDTTSRLNDLWRLWLEPSIQLRVAHWERLRVAPGVSPCPREDAVLAFDASRQCLWLYGGSTATSVLNDLWYLSLASESSWNGFTWTPVHPLGGHPLAPVHWNLSEKCMPAAAVVEDGSLYVLFSEASNRSKPLQTSERVPLYRFCLTTHHWLSCPLVEDAATSSGSSSSRRILGSLSQQVRSLRVVAACACNRFLYWLKDCTGDEPSDTQSQPAVLQVELNLLDTKPTKRRAERIR
ncbi:hypothetical protein, conserved [Leishmania tarentolae]|uniref:Uncharacterized protein n=1 Tax=Leishmania tarentolae TaxID=5689 RepID=A0A640KVX0_LEITA|nr:hypothetical protein, conserved [Leishmania tarentolae]